MFTSYYCVVQSAAWVDKVRHWDSVTGDKVYDVVHQSAVFDILSRGADKNAIVVDRSKGFAHYFRPLVGDVIRPSFSSGTDGGDIEVDVYRWTGDEARTTEFKPVAAMFLSRRYPRSGDAQGLGFGADDKLLPLKDAYPEFQPGPVYGPTTEELIGNVTDGKLPELDFAITYLLKKRRRRHRR